VTRAVFLLLLIYLTKAFPKIENPGSMIAFSFKQKRYDSLKQAKVASFTKPA
jgi:hypothetical protein